jgi:hypothetical protein
MHSLMQLYKKSVDSQTVARLSNAFYDWGKDSKDSSAVLPKGWHQEKRGAVGSLPVPNQKPMEDLLIDMFWHDDQPTHLYRYPIPLTDNNKTSLAEDHKWEPFLFFKAQRSRFYFEAYQLIFAHIFEFSNQTSKVVGHLKFNIQDVLVQRGTIELIAISRTTITREDLDMAERSGKLDWFGQELGPLDADDDVYNVLSIEWEKVIAYRTGVGRVVKAAWEAHGYEEIDVKLG